MTAAAYVPVEVTSWYTMTARAVGAPVPLVISHDPFWVNVSVPPKEIIPRTSSVAWVVVMLSLVAVVLVAVAPALVWSMAAEVSTVENSVMFKWADCAALNVHVSDVMPLGQLSR